MRALHRYLRLALFADGLPVGADGSGSCCSGCPAAHTRRLAAQRIPGCAARVRSADGGVGVRSSRD